MKELKSFWKETSNKLTKMDYMFLMIIMIFYGVIAFHNLGDRKIPKTYYGVTAGDTLNFTFEQPVKISKIRGYSGSDPGEFNIFVSADGENYEILNSVTFDYAFAWKDILINKDAKSIIIEGKTSGTTLGDIQFYDESDHKINPNPDESISLVIDELKLVPSVISYKNSLYFDETYFARTAYEYSKGITAFEWVHPPLGKLIQAIPIALLGMSPFSARLMGVLSGILLIPVMYIFAKELFKKRKYAIIASLLMTFDNFHFVHSRMGTIDTHLVLFILLAFLFMFRYLKLDRKDSLKKKLWNLFFSGLFIGCAIATKWIGVFGGVGLAILFFTHYIKNYMFGKKKWKDGIKIILPCLAFFIVVPMAIYLISYFAFPKVQPYEIHSVGDLVLQTKSMYLYHSTLQETHEFSSKWYTWPFLIKPVWYYVSYLSDATRETISGIGNPIIWWVGVVAMGYLVASFIEKRSMEKYTLLIAIASLWLPYIFIGRVMFLYHFFPVLPFMMLSIVLLLKEISERKKSDFIIWTYLVLVVIFFLLFLPISSGMEVSNHYLRYITWSDTWIF